MRKLIGSALFFAVVAVIPAEAAAQRRPAPRRAPAAAPAPRMTFGPELSLGTETDLGLGARLVFGLRSLFRRTPIDGQVGFLYFFPSVPAGPPGSNVSAGYWEVNANVAYRIPKVRGSLAPYVGGGLNIAHGSGEATFGGSTVKSSATDVGLNLLAGTTFRVKGTMIPFAEARGTVGGGGQLVIGGGLRFGL
jgi:opacity protein-like surface antigen